MSDDGSSSGEESDLPELLEGAGRMKICDDDGTMEGEDLLIDSLKSALDLFSKKTFRTAEECIEHCRDVHGLDLNVLKKRHNMDTFSYIRFINYVRTELPSPGFVMSLSSDSKWEDESFMKPVIVDDPLLMYNLDDDEDIYDEDENNGFGIDISRDLNDQIENPRRKLQHENLEEAVGRVRRELEQEMDNLQRQLQEKEAELASCRQDMIKMRSAAQSLFSGMEESGKNVSTVTGSAVIPVSQHKTVEEDYSYFKSYAHYSIHLDMLSDKVRTQSYRDALLSNSASITGQRVLDIGCGTGILSMFAARAGASSVVGVDCSDIIYQAMDIVQENKLSDVVKLVKGRLEETSLPHSSYHYIVSEWMGYFLLFEGMLDSVLAARDKYLIKDGGSMIPNRTTISMIAISDEKRYGELLDFWGDVYTFKMSCMRAPILEEASVEVVPEAAVCSDPAQVLDLDLNTCCVDDTQFNTNFTLNITRDCNLTAIVGYFDTYFDLPQKPVMFSTGPLSTPTHWKQTIFYLPAKVAVTKDQKVVCNIVCKRMKSDARSLKVSLKVDGVEHKYTVD